jgi:hypothetical protein
MSEQRTYYRLHDDDERFDNMIIVGIGWEPNLPPYLPPGADVIWSDLHVSGDIIRAAAQSGFRSVEKALLRADQMAAAYRIDRVHISIENASYWRDEWGVLVEEAE